LNPLLANLAKRNQALPFGSNVPKGGVTKLDEEAAFIGPGYYDYPDHFGQKKRSQQHSGSKKLSNQSQAFISKDQRFGYDQRLIAKQGREPGPCDYNVGMHWDRRSYNIEFSKD